MDRNQYFRLVADAARAVAGARGARVATTADVLAIREIEGAGAAAEGVVLADEVRDVFRQAAASAAGRQFVAADLLDALAGDPAARRLSVTDWELLKTALDATIVDQDSDDANHSALEPEATLEAELRAGIDRVLRMALPQEGDAEMMQISQAVFPAVRNSVRAGGGDRWSSDLEVAIARGVTLARERRGARLSSCIVWALRNPQSV